MDERDFEARLEHLLRARGEHAVEAFDPRAVAGAAIENAEQRGPRAGLRRIFPMMTQLSQPARYGLVAAVAVIAIVAGAGLLTNVTVGPSGSPSPTSSVAPSPSSSTQASATASVRPRAAPPSAVSLLSKTGSLPPGDYYIDTPFPARITFTLPPSWAADKHSADMMGAVINSADSGWGVLFALPRQVYDDPCVHDTGTELDAGAEATAQLIELISAWPTFTVVDSSQATIGGYPATRLQLQRTVELADCPEPVLLSTSLGTQLDPRPGSVDHTFELTVIDVDGTPILMRTTDYPETPEYLEALDYPHNGALFVAAQGSLHQILESIRITK